MEITFALILILQYYCEPTGQHRFRSRVEVLHFLETGSKPTKRKAASESETAKVSKNHSFVHYTELEFNLEFNWN